MFYIYFQKLRCIFEFAYIQQYDWLIKKKKNRIWDKKSNSLRTIFGDMPDLCEINETNQSDIHHIQTSNLLFKHMSNVFNDLNLQTKNNVGFCSDAASNVSSLNRGLAGMVCFYFVL